MTVPKVQPDHAPARVASLGYNPDGTMPPGIPDGMVDQDATATPTSDRGRTETAPTRIQKG